jgi:hypothetical protein
MHPVTRFGLRTYLRGAGRYFLRSKIAGSAIFLCVIGLITSTTCAQAIWPSWLTYTWGKAVASPSVLGPLGAYFEFVEAGSGIDATAVTVPTSVSNEVNAFRTIQVKLNPRLSIAELERAEAIVLIAVDIRKRGETTWNRVQISNRLSRRIDRRSALRPIDVGTEGRVFYVRDDVLDRAKFLKEGDQVAVLFFFDVSYPRKYQPDIEDLIAFRRSVLTIPLYELPVAASGEPPTPYAAHDGDEIRIRFFLSNYDVTRGRNASVLRYFSDGQLRALQRVAESLNDLRVERRKKGIADDRIESSDEFSDERIIASIQKEFANAHYDTTLDQEATGALPQLVRHSDALSTWQFGDIVTLVDEQRFVVKQFGYKLDVSGVIALGTGVGSDSDHDEMNPIKTTPSVGSNIYLTYDGRSGFGRKVVNHVLPGIHMSLLGLKEPEGTKFTLGIVHPIVPALREYFGVFFAWHDLTRPVWGFTFSPSVDFRKLVSAEGKDDR